MSDPEPTVSERIKTAIDQIDMAAATAALSADVAEGLIKATETLEGALKQIQFARAEAQAHLDRF